MDGGADRSPFFPPLNYPPLLRSHYRQQLGKTSPASMGSTFNPQILVDKLTKLNVSQTSIETLSHWCIFHMYKAKQVVETWDKQFHCAPRERLAFLYLANDILQNSRRKGSDFVGEFWKVLPDALRDVIQNGDEFGRASAMRLIHIWEERKVFGSRGQILKEEFLGRKIESTNGNGKDSGLKLRHNAGSALDNIVTGYQIVYGGPMDDEAVLSKCLNIMDFFDKVEKEISDDNNSEKFSDSAFADELRRQSAMLRNCIDQLTTVESSRARLVSNLREALEEQEFQLDQVRNQLQSARSRSELANKLCHQFLNGNGNGNNRPLSVDPSLKDAQSHNTPAEREQSAPVMYTRQVQSFPNRSAIEEDTRKSAAAEVAAKLSASTSSAQMLSYVLSSLASEDVTSHKAEDSPPEKRSKTQSSSPYIPSLPPNNPLQPPLPPLDPSVPPPPTSPPPMPPLPPMPSYPMLQPPSFTPLSGPSNGLPYYGMTQQLQQQPLPPPPPSAPSYTPISGGLPPFTGQPPPAGPYPGFPGSDGNNLYSQPPPAPMAPISRQ